MSEPPFRILFVSDTSRAELMPNKKHPKQGTYWYRYYATDLEKSQIVGKEVDLELAQINKLISFDLIKVL